MSGIPGREDWAVPHAAKPSRGPDAVSHISHQLPAHRIRCRLSNRTEKLSVPAKQSSGLSQLVLRQAASHSAQPGSPEPRSPAANPQFPKSASHPEMGTRDFGREVTHPLPFWMARGHGFPPAVHPTHGQHTPILGAEGEEVYVQERKEGKKKVPAPEHILGALLGAGRLACAGLYCQSDTGLLPPFIGWKLRLRPLANLPRPQTPV